MFHIADDNGLLLLDLKDLRTMVNYVGEHAKEYTLSYGQIATQSIVKVWGIGDAMGKPDHAFTTAGTNGQGWYSEDDVTAPNGKAMRSGAITHNQTSKLSTIVVGPGVLSFSWKKSDVDAYLIDEWKFDISFLRGPGICFRLECQVTQESSVHHPEHCCLHKQCLPTSPSLTPRSPASLVSECSVSLIVPFL